MSISIQGSAAALATLESLANHRPRRRQRRRRSNLPLLASQSASQAAAVFDHRCQRRSERVQRRLRGPGDLGLDRRRRRLRRLGDRRVARTDAARRDERRQPGTSTSDLRARALDQGFKSGLAQIQKAIALGERRRRQPDRRLDRRSGQRLGGDADRRQPVARRPHDRRGRRRQPDRSFERRRYRHPARRGDRQRRPGDRPDLRPEPGDRGPPDARGPGRSVALGRRRWGEWRARCRWRAPRRPAGSAATLVDWLEHRQPGAERHFCRCSRAA